MKWPFVKRSTFNRVLGELSQERAERKRLQARLDNFEAERAVAIARAVANFARRKRK